MSASSLQDLYIEKLQDLYSAEQQILEALPKMIKKTSNAQLRRAFEEHLAQTEEQARRVELLCQQLNTKPNGKECVGMKGIIKDAEEELEDAEEAATIDALLIAGAQSVEHYEIAGYGTARTWARQCGLEDDARLLQQTLDEEAQTDELLTTIAESLVNERALDEREVVRSAASEGGGASVDSSNNRPRSDAEDRAR